MRVRPSSMLSATLLAFAIVVFASGAGVAQELLHSFAGEDGYNLYGGLVMDAAHNLYGTANDGGRHGEGTVFRLSSAGHGHWAETVLVNFNGDDGDGPHAGLIFDSAGNLYGNTTYGGRHGDPGSGTVFELSPNGDGGWSETVLYSFDPANGDGTYPWAPLTMDAAGNLYGTTFYGGIYTDDCPKGCGTVFELSRNGSEWVQAVLYRFDSHDHGAIEPSRGALVFDREGNLYGTTLAGGEGRFGTVYELSPNGHDEWIATILHAFGEDDPAGQELFAGVIFDAGGNLYGATYFGGEHDGGTVFSLSPNGSGGWMERVLHTFAFNGDPIGTLVFDSRGNLYGTTTADGPHGDGSVFKLSRGLGGSWTETILGSFDGTNGKTPEGPLLFDAAGNIYGTTAIGGHRDGGVVFEISR